MADSHECPAPGCGRALPHSIFACRAHWAVLPRALRGALASAWKGLLAGDHESLDHYLKAREEAAAWYNDQLP